MILAVEEVDKARIIPEKMHVPRFGSQLAFCQFGIIFTTAIRLLLDSVHIFMNAIQKITQEFLRIMLLEAMELRNKAR